MKQKYILETYDQILKEIKNPKIVFDNDFVTFLKDCSADSYLIYKIDFVKQNGETKYTIKNPIHNLHPKAAEINGKNCELVSEFEEYIPEIYKKLEINHQEANFRWCSKKDSNTLYILQEIEISTLSNELRFFLYCFHSLKNENDKIKKINKETIFNFKSKERVEQYIHKKQYALENLANKLIKDINPINSSDIYRFSSNYDKIDCLKITYIYLEKLLRFIEKEFKNYLNVNIQIPYRSILVKEFEITDKLKELKSRLLESNINDQLLKLVYEPLLKIATINIQEKLTYYDFNYCSDFILILHHQIDFENITEEAIKDCMFDLNFNSLQFFKHLTPSASIPTGSTIIVYAEVIFDGGCTVTTNIPFQILDGTNAPVPAGNFILTSNTGNICTAEIFELAFSSTNGFNNGVTTFSPKFLWGPGDPIHYRVNKPTNVTVCYKNLCTGLSTCKVFTVYPPAPCAIANRIASTAVTAELIIAPNPTNGNLIVTLPETLSGNYQVFDQINSILVQEAKFDNQTELQIDLSPKLKAGIYVLKVITENNTFTEKIILNK